MSSTARRADKVYGDLRDDLEAITREPLPEGWLDLIIRLDAEEDARTLKSTSANDA